MAPGPKIRFNHPRGQRLRGRTRFDEVFKTGQRRMAHPLTVCALRREDNGPARLGISIGTRCGNAVMRNGIKRRLREAFRLMQHDVPPGMDYLVIVRRHTPLKMQEYQARFRQLLT